MNVTANAYHFDTTNLGQLIKRHGDADGAIGDCFRTTIACLIGATRPDIVPHVVQQTIEAGLNDKGGWEDIAAMRRWLRGEGLDLLMVDRAQADELGIAYKLTVRSQAGPWNHCVVARRGEVIWDPAERHTYTMADAFPDEPVGIITEPYEPDPDEMLRQWRAEDAAATPDLWGTP